MADTEHGWLIEHGDSEPSAPRYWAVGAYFNEVSDPRRSSSWTENHNEAIRFARQLDAERVVQRCMRGIPTRVCHHEWS